MSVGHEVEIRPSTPDDGGRVEPKEGLAGRDLTGLRGLVVRGTFWTVASYGAGQVLRLASNLVMASLLVPEVFGLMALVQSFIAGLAMFSDVGTSTSIIRHPRGDEPEFLNTAWTMQVLRGCWLGLGSMLLAFPVARIYGDDRLLALLPLVGVGSLIGGFTSTSLFTLSRRLGVGRQSRYELATQLVSMIVVLLTVYFYRSIWSLVIGGLFGSVIRVIWSHRLGVGPPNRFAWDRASAREILSFGKWVFLSTAVAFFAEQSDRLILGKLLTMEMLGIYSISAALADMPRQISSALHSKVVFPAISRLLHLSRPEMRAKIIAGRRPILVCWALGLALMVGSGDLMIGILYDRRYQLASWMLPLLALGIWPRLLCNTIECALFVVGRPQYSTFASVLRFLTTAIGICLGYAWIGLPGAVIAIAFNDVPYYIAANFGLHREGLGALKQDLGFTALFLTAAALVIWVRVASGSGVPWGGLP
jgi:O-antigen/teichoic acid export membrane protein